MLRAYIPPEDRPQSSYRWVMLVMAALTPMLVFAMPNMSLPVLFNEIATELNLSLVQVGIIWGINSLTGMFIGLLAGTIGDRFGSRQTLIVACFLTGVLGMLRGFATNFEIFVATSLLVGMVQPAIPIYVNKVAIEWFARSQLSTATGFISAGFATGLMLGALLSASFLSPLLGGWRPVMVFYGVIGILFSVLWWIVYPRNDTSPGAAKRAFIPLRQGLPHVMRLRSIWLLGLGAMGVRACVAGMTGYLPTYLRNIGWASTSADNALAAFFAVSLIGVIPLSMLSDRLGARRRFLIVAAIVLAVGTSMISVATGNLVWPAVMFAGLVFDAFMAIYNASIMEAEGVGPAYAGTALGFAGMLRNLGGTLSPPIGNSLAAFGLSVPFAFWGLLAFLGCIFFLMLPPRQKVKA